MRAGSPDDTHMAMRYARFLEIMVNSSHPRSDAPASPQGLAQGGDVGYVASLRDFGVPDIDPALGSIGDLVDWSDGSFGIIGAIGLLPNM